MLTVIIAFSIVAAVPLLNGRPYDKTDTDSQIVQLGKRRIESAWFRSKDPFRAIIKWHHKHWPDAVVEQLSRTSMPPNVKIDWTRDAHLREYPHCFADMHDGWDTFTITAHREAFGWTERVFNKSETLRRESRLCQRDSMWFTPC